MSSSLSLMGKYQLAVLGSPGDPQVSESVTRLGAALELGFNQLGVNPRKFLVRLLPPEKMLRTVSVPVALLRAGWFMQNAASVLNRLEKDRGL
jgi:hypothetical protein